VFVIEWGKDFVTTLTDQYLEINIDRGQKDDQRQVEFVMVGERWENFKL
jgi:tRNA threonylcarbamoyladenosine biosynthesis protein TsaE